MDTSGIDIGKRGWLAELLTVASSEAANSEVADGGSQDFDAWLEEHLLVLGYGFGGTSTLARDAQVGQRLFKWDIARQALLVNDVARFLGKDLGGDAVESATGAALAAATDQASTLEAVLGGVATSAVLGGLETALLETLIADDHPLVGGAFHRLILQTGARLVGQLARDYFEGQLDSARAARRLAAVRGQRAVFIEAVIGLAHADGHLDMKEKRLVREFIRVGRFAKVEMAQLSQRLRGGQVGLDGIRNADIAARDRAYVLAMVVFAALIDHEFSEDEQGYLSELADALEIDTPTRVGIFGDVARLLLTDKGATRGLSAAGFVGRARGAARRHIEVLIGGEAAAVAELIKADEALWPLVEASCTRELEADERADARARLAVLGEQSAALSAFAAQGGALLLPVLASLLPLGLDTPILEIEDES